MTEAEWRDCTEPGRMLDFLGGRLSERKLRLFGCACCRAVWDDAWPTRSRAAVEASERFADGLAADREIDRARSRACESAQNADRYGRSRQEHAGRVLVTRLFFAADNALRGKPPLTLRHNVFDGDEQLRQAGHPLLRCVAGDPFRPAAADPAWLTSTVVTLAATIYAGRAFHDLPILADALQDAGCDDADILAHCRGDGPHVRGCWVVDLVLGKA